MQDIGNFAKLAELDALIEQVKRFHDLSPMEQLRVLDSVLLWLSLDQEALSKEKTVEVERQQSAFKNILAWCQTDDYAYKDWK